MKVSQAINPEVHPEADKVSKVLIHLPFFIFIDKGHGWEIVQLP